jgi:hypothetical protein
MNMQSDGGCLCGGVRYRLHEQPKQLSDCHCIDCRRASGAPFVTWGAFRREKIELLSGELRKVRHADRLRSFARCCGTPLFFQDNDESEWIDVTIVRSIGPRFTRPRSPSGRKTDYRGFPWIPRVRHIDRAGEVRKSSQRIRLPTDKMFDVRLNLQANWKLKSQYGF